MVDTRRSTTEFFGEESIVVRLQADFNEMKLTKSPHGVRFYVVLIKQSSSY